jgi:hypothetical protein
VTEKGAILFWDVYNENIGGIERLIITLSEELSKSQKVKIIGKKTGAVYNELFALGIPFLFIDEELENFHTKVDKSDVFIIFGVYRSYIKLRKSNPFILYWRVYPSLCLQSNIQKILMRETLQYLAEKSSLFFMDIENWRTVSKELMLELPKNILPIPIKKRNIKLRYSPPYGNFINITYVGRGNEIWKIKPVKKMLEDISKLNDFTFKVHIFTDSDKLFKNELISFHKSPNIEIEYLFGFYGEKLSRELLARSNIHYSMGTSALEGASLGIPTLIADPSFQEFPSDYKYRWIIEDLENYAGIFLTTNSRSKGVEIIDIINQVLNPKYAVKLSTVTKNVIESNFEISMIIEKILSKNSMAKLFGILKYMPRYWMSFLNL